jgi:hypothetical protein
MGKAQIPFHWRSMMIDVKTLYQGTVNHFILIISLWMEGGEKIKISS